MGTQAPDFKALLRRPADDVKRPPPLPEGTYYGIIKGHIFDLSSEKKTPYVRFEYTLTGPGDDVEQSELEGIDLSKRNINSDFFLTDDAMYRLKEFLEALGIPTRGRSMDELIPEAVGQNVLLELQQQPNRNDPEAPPYTRVKKVSAAA